MPLPFLIGAVLLVLLAGFSAAWLGRTLGRRRLVDDLPTLPAAGVFIGMVEVHGTAESEQPLIGFLSEQPVVLYRWTVAEHWIRTRTVTETDSKGNTRTRTETYSGSDTVASGGEDSVFWLADESGLVQVDPSEATLSVARVFDSSVGRDDELYYAKGPETSVSGSTGRRTFREEALPLHREVYVIGQSRLREDGLAPVIAGGGEVGLFRIAIGGEQQVRRGLGWSVFFIGLLTFALGGGAVALVGYGAAAGQWGPHGFLHEPETWVPFAAPGAALALVLTIWVWVVRNGLVDLRERVRQARSLVDIELQRRSDLVPRLVAVVEASAGHEREVQSVLAKLRAQAGATIEGEGGVDPEGLAPSLRAVVERYPDLDASEAFADLHERLVDAEDRIARARSYANAIATNYDDRLEQVPDTFMARLLGLKSFPVLAAHGFERRAIEIDFA